MLDFGNPNDAEQDPRYSDHTDVWKIYEELPEIEDIQKKFKCMKDYFINQYLYETGAMRINTFTGGEINLEMFQPRIPTKKQMETLEYCTCIIKPDEVLLEFAHCEDDIVRWRPMSAQIRDDCVEPIKDLNRKIKRWSATTDS